MAGHAEMSEAENLALATAVQEAVAEAIMVVGSGGRLLAMNRRFREMCELPDSLHAATRADDILEHLKSLVKDPESLRTMVRTSVAQPGAVYTNDIELKDGRTFERYVAPVLATDGALYGRLICYRDATLRRQVEAQRTELAESARKLLEAERETARLLREQARRLERELEIASQIQASMLPREFTVAGYEVAGLMVPATEVGGDYYDVIPTDDGLWLGIGDVSGHGLTAGLIMLMTQSAVGALVRRDPTVAPAVAIDAVNVLLVENIRQRMRTDEHMTLSLLHADARGLVRYAGAHEDMFVYRSQSRSIDVVETRGSWVGIRKHLADATVESQFELGRGDVLLMYTDGILEARDEQRSQFGPQRVRDVLAASADKPANDICRDVIAAVASWAPVADDDRSVVVVRRA